MDKTVNILGVNISSANVSEAAQMILDSFSSGKKISVFTPNSEIILSAYKDENFKNIINSASLCTADGIGVIYASKIFGTPIPERCSGYDISLELIKQMSKTGSSVYLFGASPGVAETAKKKIEEANPGINIVGYHDGYFDAEEEKNIINDINEKKPNLLFVCLGSPKQEKWIYDNLDKLDINAALGLGGCLDVYAGNVKRAPKIFIKLGLEWFYRLIKEPKRFFRMLALPKFMLTVLKIKFFGGKK
ncbi:MAG: WecB/TagA/CpsF family glycosyltransferase [Clostridia bacterium]|nr:WecB/TagA/CpsF family glycosyltransferase [Clostridia bacterium]